MLAKPSKIFQRMTTRAEGRWCGLRSRRCRRRSGRVPSRLKRGPSSALRDSICSRDVSRSAIASWTRGLFCARQLFGFRQRAGIDADRSGGMATASIGTPVRVWNWIAAVSRSSRASVTRARAACSRSSACCWSAIEIDPLGDAFAQIAGEPFVEGHIVLGDRHQPLLQQIVDIGAADVRARRIRCAPRSRAAAASVRDAWRLISASRPPLFHSSSSATMKPSTGFSVSSAMPRSAAGRVAQLAHAGRTLDRNARIPQALGLLALFLGGQLVVHGLPDFGIGLERGLDRVPQIRRRTPERRTAAAPRERSTSSASSSCLPPSGHRRKPSPSTREGRAPVSR